MPRLSPARDDDPAVAIQIRARQHQDELRRMGRQQAEGCPEESFDFEPGLVAV